MFVLYRNKCLSLCHIKNNYNTNVYKVMIGRKELKEKLPYGYAKVAAERAGVSCQSVSRYLNGHGNSQKIETAVLEIIAELNLNRKKLLENIL